MYVKHRKFSHIVWLRKLKNCSLLQKNYTEEEKNNFEFILIGRFLRGIACIDSTHIQIITSIDEYSKKSKFNLHYTVLAVLRRIVLRVVGPISAA